MKGTALRIYSACPTNRLDNLELMPSQTHHLPLNLLQTQLYELQSRVTRLEAENALLQYQLEGMLIPSQTEDIGTSSGVCRDLTGDNLERVEEKVHSPRKLGGKSA